MILVTVWLCPRASLQKHRLSVDLYGFLNLEP